MSRRLSEPGCCARRGLIFGSGPFCVSGNPRRAMAYAMEYGLEWTRSHHPTPNRGDTHMPCDCGATPEDQDAGIHHTPCTSHDGEPDDPSDHYGQ